MTMSRRQLIHRYTRRDCVRDLKPRAVDASSPQDQQERYPPRVLLAACAGEGDGEDAQRELRWLGASLEQHMRENDDVIDILIAGCTSSSSSSSSSSAAASERESKEPPALVLGNRAGVRRSGYGIDALPAYFAPFDIIILLLRRKRGGGGKGKQGDSSTRDDHECVRNALVHALRLTKDSSTIAVIGDDMSTSTGGKPENIDVEGLPLIRATWCDGGVVTAARDALTRRKKNVTDDDDDQDDSRGDRIGCDVYVVPELYSLQYGVDLHRMAPWSPHDASMQYLMAPFHGRVVHGFGRGSAQMGIPTANVDVTSASESNDPAMLSKMPRGVYMGFCIVDLGLGVGDEERGICGDAEERVSSSPPNFQVFNMVMNKGTKPTFALAPGEAPSDTYEVHVLGLELADGEELYGRRLGVVCAGYLRPERRFENVTALVRQIKTDAGAAAKLLSSAKMKHLKNGYAFVLRKAYSSSLSISS